MKTDISRFHGYDERISVDNYKQVVQFYHRVIINADTLVEEKNDNSDDVGSGEADNIEMEFSGNDNITNIEDDEYQLQEN